MSSNIGEAASTGNSTGPAVHAETGKGGNDSGATPAADGEFKAITSQDEFERALGKRLERERSKFSDYSDLKAKAERFDEIEQANKSELEKVQEAAKVAQEQRDEAVAQSARLRIALEHQLSKDDAELLNDLRDEEAMQRLAARLAAQAAQQGGRVGIQVDHSGTQTTHSPTKDDAARQFFGI